MFTVIVYIRSHIHLDTFNLIKTCMYYDEGCIHHRDQQLKAIQILRDYTSIHVKVQIRQFHSVSWKP